MARKCNKCFMSPTTKIIVMSLIGMAFTLMEATYTNVKENLEQVAKLPLHNQQFSASTMLHIKSILKYVVLARSYTVLPYLISYVCVAYVPIVEKNSLFLLPWLMISVIRNILVDTVVTSTGGFICALQSSVTPICLEFLGVKLLQLVLSLYMWKSVFTLYHDLRKPDFPEEDTAKQQFELAVRRRMTKTLEDDVAVRRRLIMTPCDSFLPTSLSNECDLTYEHETSTKAKHTRSLDSILSQLNLDIDMIESLFERRNIETMDHEEQEMVPLSVRAKRFLRLTTRDIENSIAEKNIRSEHAKSLSVQDNASTQVNTLSKKFLTVSESVHKQNKRSVATVDAATQVNTLSRRWLQHASSFNENSAEQKHSSNIVRKPGGSTTNNPKNVSLVLKDTSKGKTIKSTIHPKSVMSPVRTLHTESRPQADLKIDKGRPFSHPQNDSIRKKTPTDNKSCKKDEMKAQTTLTSEMKHSKFDLQNISSEAQTSLTANIMKHADNPNTQR